MSSMLQWEHLLGLPLETALERARAAGVEPAVLRTSAPPRRGAAQEAEDSRPTERVIRVCQADGVLQLVAAAFMDGDPRYEK